MQPLRKQLDYKRYRENDPRYNIRRSYKSRYGLSLEEYDKMIEAQGSTCAICRKKKKLVVDHNHKTGKIRGLLCSNCNTALGLVYDDVSLLQSAIEYLVFEAKQVEASGCDPE